MIKNYMNGVAKLLGVELNEEFKIETFLNSYKLTEQGLFFKNGRKWEYADATLSDLLTGKIEIVKSQWKPRINEVYYCPSNNFLFSVENEWFNTVEDKALFKCGLVFQTEKECEKALPELRKIFYLSE